MTANNIRSFARGTALFSSGDPAVAAYFLLDGKVLVVRGEERLNLGPGAFLGAVAFFQEKAHTYTALCSSEVTAAVITKENSREIAAKQPAVVLSLLRELALQVPETEELTFFQGRLEEKVEAQAARQILPDGHPVFSGTVPVEYGDLLFAVEAECPACGTKFSAMRTRVSRLQLAEQKPDFRTVYRNFEPNYFYLWVCPKCWFAYPERLFGRVAERAVRKWQEAVEAEPPTGTFEFSVPRAIQEAITAYYLAMRTYEVIGAPPDLWANLWLRLVWIYEDLQAGDLALKAAERARDYFAKTMATTAHTAAGDQRLHLILGELDLRLGRQGEAFRNFHAAATMSGGDTRLKRAAADRIQDLRGESQ